MASPEDHSQIPESFLSYRKASSHLLSILQSKNYPTPHVGIICGSGLSGLSDTMTDTLSVPYHEVPGFPSHCTVQGHKGEMVFGKISGTICVCFRGRFHTYEGHDINTTALPVRIMRCLGVKLVIITNAAGGINSTYNVGDIVSIMDHFALPLLSGKNPLVGKNDSELGPRFPPTSNLYDFDLQDILSEGASNLDYGDFFRRNGTYCFVSGPNYESKAECQFLKNIGGDVVGMSTIPEVVAAHHCGMKVICLSLVTNKVVITGEEGPAASHAEVLEAVDKRSVQIQLLVKEFIQLSHDYIQNLPGLPPITLDLGGSKNEAGTCPPTFSSYICGIPMHRVTMGAGILAIGGVIGMKILSKRV